MLSVGAVRLNTAFRETTGTSTVRSVHFRAEARLAKTSAARRGDEGVYNISNDCACAIKFSG